MPATATQPKPARPAPRSLADTLNRFWDRKIVKISAWTIAAVVWIPFIVVILTVMGINPLFTMGVTKLGSESLKVPVTLGRASISFTGKLSLGRFEIRNPQGFSEMEAASFDGLYAEAPFRSVFFVQDMEIPVLTVVNPVFNLELDRKGKTSNWGVIMKNLARSLPKKGEPVPPDDEKRFKIDELKIVNPVVYYRSSKLKKPIKIDLKDVELKQVGNTPGSRSKLYIVLATILQAVLTGGIEAGDDLPRDVKGALTEELSEMSKLFGAYRGSK